MASPLISPGASHPVLDPMVQTFLDRHAEGSLEPLPPCGPVQGFHLLHPVRHGERPLPILVYLQDIAGPSRAQAMQMLADRTGFAVLLHAFPADADAGTVERAMLNALAQLGKEGAALGIDPARMVMGGDGLGALVATAFASRKGHAGHRPALLILATPVLDEPAEGFGTAWLSTRDAQAAKLPPGDEGWPAHYPHERLRRMPPTVLVTADMDPFRDGAEAFARRLMAADVEVAASRTLGTIHDFTWLPGLAHACGTLGAHDVITGALRACFAQGA